MSVLRREKAVNKPITYLLRGDATTVIKSHCITGLRRGNKDIFLISVLLKKWIQSTSVSEDTKLDQNKNWEPSKIKIFLYALENDKNEKLLTKNILHPILLTELA